jgi:ABC-type antimicrobial peptide transport system permease subunit
MDVVARMQPGSALSAATLRGALRTAYPNAGLTVRSAIESLDPAVQQPRFQAYLLTSFAVCALLLAAFGMYTVSSLDVALRRYEMGVRLSLGATAQELRWLVMRTSLGPVVMGVALGLVGSWWAGQFMQTLLVEGQARDPLMMALSAAILVGAAAAAAWWPARRAAKTDPATVLRAQ